MEGVVVVKDSGVENFTDFLPSGMDEIKKTIREEGLVQIRPPAPPLKGRN